MILDTLENMRQYLPLNKGFPPAFDFLRRRDLRQLPPGRYEIDGDRVYAMVANVPGRGKDGAFLETHERYIDIQLVLAGTDEMGWKPAAACRQPIGAYDPAADIRFFADDPDGWFPVQPGWLAVFFPEDAHLPLISSGRIHKVVVKVAAEQK